MASPLNLLNSSKLGFQLVLAPWIFWVYSAVEISIRDSHVGTTGVDAPILVYDFFFIFLVSVNWDYVFLASSLAIFLILLFSYSREYFLTVMCCTYSILSSGVSDAMASM
jgi:hypothetical protein